MITENKILKVECAKQNLAFMLIALDVKFAYSYGVFYILNIQDVETFLNYCARFEVPKSEVEKMVITVTTCEEI